jgi:hypothetical protein
MALARPIRQGCRTNSFRRGADRCCIVAGCLCLCGCSSSIDGGGFAADLEPEQAEPEQAEPEQAEPEQAEPEQVETEQEQAEPEQVETEQVETGQAEPELQLSPVDSEKSLTESMRDVRLDEST